MNLFNKNRCLFELVYLLVFKIYFINQFQKNIFYEEKENMFGNLYFEN